MIYLILWIAGIPISFFLMRHFANKEQYYKDFEHPTAYEAQKGDFIIMSILLSWAFLFIMTLGVAIERILNFNDK